MQFGYIFQNYRVEKILGRGGFGITYLATDLGSGLQVAIKEYFPKEIAKRGKNLEVRPLGNAENKQIFEWGRAQFLNEAKILAQLDHPNVISVKRYFRENETAYLVMEYFEGESLTELLKNESLGVENIKIIFYSLLDGLEHIHNNNLLHRDIKPSNIYINSDGRPVLLDFGSAKTLVTSNKFNHASDGYAPPEQYNTRSKQGPWSDIYGLAATFYRTISGVKPQPSFPDRILQDQIIPLTNLDIFTYSFRFLDAIDKALSISPELRPQSVEEFRKAIGERRGKALGLPVYVKSKRIVPPVAIIPSAALKTGKSPKQSFFLFVAIVFIIGIFAFIIIPFNAGTDRIQNDNIPGAKPKPIRIE